MKITKEYLQQHIIGLAQQLETQLEQVGMIRGAIDVCRVLVDHLEAPEPELPPQPSKSVFDGADVEGLARGSPMDVEGNVDE